MKAPFDLDKLDLLMENAGIDVVLASSRHNVRYLTGSYSRFFAHFDAIGIDRFQPFAAYVRSRPELAFAIGSELDAPQHAHEPLWLTTVDTSFTTAESVAAAASLLEERGISRARIGVEEAFLPIRAFELLRAGCPDATFLDASTTLEELRAVKTSSELAQMRAASEGIIGAMAAVMLGAPREPTTRELAQSLRTEETLRGIEFEYCLAAAGRSFDRVPGDTVWSAGGILSLDSGGSFHGYIGDVCRMAVRGRPTELMVEVLDEIRQVQEAAFKMIRPGALGAEVDESGRHELARSAHAAVGSFIVHGIGLVTHELPRVMNPSPVRSPTSRRDRQLEAGMVLSIECEMKVEGTGFIKLEDTVAVTEDGFELYGGDYRDWIVSEP